LKLLSDVLFYMTFAGLISALIGAQGRDMGNSGLISVLPFLLVSIFCLGLLSERGKLKYAAFLPLFAAIMGAWNYGLIHLILLGPAIAYIVYYSTTLPYDIRTVSHTNVFRMYLIITLPICIFFSANFTFFGAFMNGVMGPYLIMFVTASIVLMRMIRHDAEILNQRKFKIMNTLSVSAVILTGLFLGSQTGLRVMRIIFHFLYFNVFINILYLVLIIVGALLYPFARLFGLEPLEMIWPTYSADGDADGWEEIIAEQPEPGIAYLIFQILVFIGLAVAAFFILRALFRFLTAKQLIREMDPVRTERVSINDTNKAKRKEPRVNHQIRQVYRKFLKLCKNRGITLHPNLTTADIAATFAQATGEHESTKALREIYIDSRYGEKTPTSNHVKEAKEIYGKLKKASPSRTSGKISEL